ncbi:MAG TPA: valine--tRNA ligase [Candidatus Dojkabacteria bacterium]|nr:valine--tRNA ligase [Candidatus Dojkabacteria bacterium]
MNTKISESMPKAFDSNIKEKEMIKIWDDSGYFKPENVESYLKKEGLDIKDNFTITLPPPNANGDLHLGHTCGYSFQDLMGRFNRMTGHPTLLLPGKDHAGIQTEAVFTKILEKQGESKWDLGREEFYKRCYEFCMEKAANARAQEKAIGLSADFEREMFTLDPRLNKIVYETFYNLFEKKDENGRGLIYRDKRIINQCPYCRTALADIDTEHEEMRGIFAYIIYPFVDEADKKLAKEKLGQEGIVVATTRPETMLGDTAVAVNPKDERYKEFVGKKVMLPIANREIPIITDRKIDIETGTGALKVTPAHSPIDFEIAKRNKLEAINVINEDGKMSGDIPERFLGMDTVDCSKALVAELKDLGLLVKIENIKHSVTVCERCKTPIQPIISHQWFLNVEPFAKAALEELKKGNTKIMPAGQQRALEFFLKNIEPWCISRQLWWGQRIPVWYSGGKKLYDWLMDNPKKTPADYEKETGIKAIGTGKIFMGETMPTSDPDWKGNESDLLIEAETDMFDTWFSSGQWPYSTLKALFPNEKDFNKYYPTQVMETARDILFFWVARMMMLGKYVTGKTPFKDVFLHGLVFATDGTKMSKSKGNVVLPAGIIEKYGADALRLWYYISALPGSNVSVDEEKIKGNRFFINKIWNASRFVLMNIEEELDEVIKSEKDIKETKKIKEAKKELKKISNYIVKYQFNLAAENIREFFWHTYCDKWIEETKAEIAELKVGDKKRIEKLSELIYILKLSLKIMHPMIPFITESVWQELKTVGLAKGDLLIQQIEE